MNLSSIRLPSLGKSGGPDISVLDPSDRKAAEAILAKADVLEQAGMTSSAERLRNQVRGWCNSATVDTGIASKREQIKSRQATQRYIKHRK